MTAETALAAHLAAHGWPDAEATLAGIRGTGRVLWYVPGDRTAEHAGDGLVGDWLDEAQTLAADVHADIGVLVTRRESYGRARLTSWWAWLDIAALSRIVRADLAVPEVITAGPVAMHLSTAIVLLRVAGLGEPLAPAGVAP